MKKVFYYEHGYNSRRLYTTRKATESPFLVISAIFNYGYSRVALKWSASETNKNFTNEICINPKILNTPQSAEKALRLSTSFMLV